MTDMKYKFSRFFHVFEREGVVCCYNALTISTIYIPCMEFDKIKAYIAGNNVEYDDAIFHKMLSENMIIPYDTDEELLLEQIRSEVFNGVKIRVMAVSYTHLILNVGYSQEEKTWELIVKYTGNLQKYADERIQIVELYNEYAIITVPENMVTTVSEWPEVEYVEKPKRLYFQTAQGKRASCISLVQVPPLGLTGRGVLVAVIDSGIDYRHEEFLYPDGTSSCLLYTSPEFF